MTITSVNTCSLILFVYQKLMHIRKIFYSMTVINVTWTVGIIILKNRVVVSWYFTHISKFIQRKTTVLTVQSSASITVHSQALESKLCKSYLSCPIDKSVKDMLRFKLDKGFFKLPSDLYLCFDYISPKKLFIYIED
jgi:hypothetical protein